jgi:hypothetical protein
MLVDSKVVFRVEESRLVEMVLWYGSWGDNGLRGFQGALLSRLGDN